MGREKKTKTLRLQIPEVESSECVSAGQTWLPSVLSTSQLPFERPLPYDRYVYHIFFKLKSCLSSVAWLTRRAFAENAPVGGHNGKRLMGNSRSP